MVYMQDNTWGGNGSEWVMNVQRYDEYSKGRTKLVERKHLMIQGVTEGRERKATDDYGEL
jgi:hypothetical protein